MVKGQAANIAKGIAGGMIAGVAVGIVGKNLLDNKPKMKKKANRAISTVGQLIDTAQYLFK
ncbi:MAG: hypothetical protein J1E41_02995 [Ruminococcus sp.]|nr:hypothetical protein [Ruminococcus sp.]